MTADPRYRTDVALPRSFGMLVAGYGLLGGILPLCLGASVAAWSPLAINAFIIGLFGTMVLGMINVLPLALGTRRRRVWWIRWVRGFGFALLAAYALTWPIVLAHPLGLFPLLLGGDPALIAVGWLAVIMLAAIGLPAAALLGYALRHPYWDLDAPREQWTT